MNKIPLTDSAGNVLGILGTYEEITQYRKTIEELELNEARYKSLFENSPISLWEEDFSGVKHIMDQLKRKRVKHFERYLKKHPEIFENCIKAIKINNVNQATLKFMKRSSKEEIIKIPTNRFSTDSENIFFQEFNTLYNGTTHYQSPPYRQTIAGDKKWLISNVTIAPGYEQTWAKVFVSVFDITEQKENEIHLLESENKYRFLFENANDAIAILKGNTIIDVNSKTLELYRAEKKDMIGKNPALDFSPEYQPDGSVSVESGEKIFDNVLSGQGRLFEWAQKRLDNTIFPAEISLNAFHLYNEKLILAVVRNITERIKAQERILQGEKKHRTLFETMAQGAIYQDKDGAVISVNPAAQKILGYNEAELKGNLSTNKKWKALREDGTPFPEKERPSLMAIKLTKPVYHVTMGVYNHVEKANKWLILNTTPHFDQNGKLDYITTTFDDITEQKNAADKLKKFAETQEVLLQEVNHRVKNNLSAIISILHKEMDRAESEGHQSYLPLLTNLEGRVSGLLTVHSMLSSSKWQPLLLDDLCEKIIANALKIMPMHQKINLSVSNSVVKINSRIAQNLSIVLNELTTNTVKYAMKDREQVRIRINIRKTAQNIKLAFKDDGPGFPPNVLKGNFKSTKIGFGLIQGIIQHSLNGKIKLYNDNGAVIEMQFPNKGIEK